MDNQPGAKKSNDAGFNFQATFDEKKRIFPTSLYVLALTARLDVLYALNSRAMKREIIKDKKPSVEELRRLVQEV